MSRLTGMLEKAFKLLNEDWFEGKLETPIITVIPTPRAYAHYTTANMWKTASGGSGRSTLPAERSTGRLKRSSLRSNTKWYTCGTTP